MKKISAIFVLSILATVIIAQPNRYRNQYHNRCEEFPELVDSLHNFTWDAETETWELATVWQFENNNGRHDRLVYVNIIEDKRYISRAWDYYYDLLNNKDLEIAKYYNSGIWYNQVKKESEFSLENKKINETTSYWRNNNWVIYKYFQNDYDIDGNLIKVNYQELNSNGLLEDVQYAIYTYSNDQLIIELFDATSNALETVYKYYYNNDNSLAEFWIYTPDVENPNNLIQTQKRTYYYDEYGIKREVLFQNWTGEEWVKSSKYLYFVKLDNARKVSICHNGHSICVSVNALPSFLRRGSSLGECEEDAYENGNRHNNKNKTSYNYGGKKSLLINGSENSSNPISVYPNPATEMVTVTIPLSTMSDKMRIELIDFYGRVVRTYDINGENEFSFQRENLQNGHYFLRYIGKETSTAILHLQ